MKELDETTQQAWAALEARLTQFLATMTHGSEDHLVLAVDIHTSDTGCAPYVQFASFGDAMIRAEASSDAFLAVEWQQGAEAEHQWRAMGWRGYDESEPNFILEMPAAMAAILANNALSAIRGSFGIGHPSELACRAWGPAAVTAETLGLKAGGEALGPPEGWVEFEAAEAEMEAANQIDAPAVIPDDPDHLRVMVGAVLRKKMGLTPEVDDDGDFIIEHRGHRVLVIVHEEMAAVELMTLVVDAVRSRRATAVELGLLNRDHPWAKWTLHERRVFQRQMLSAYPLAPRHLQRAVEDFQRALDLTSEDLVQRTGGRSMR